MTTIKTIALCAALSACDGRVYSTEGDADGGPGDPAAAAAAMFTADVEPILSDSCASCHAAAPGGAIPGFLHPSPDVYTAIKAWPNLVVPGDPEASRLYAYGRSAQHSGPVLLPEQAEVVRAWIELEPPADAPEPEPESQRFAPLVGQNTVDLAPLADGLDGATLTFVADQLAAGIYLTELTVHSGDGGVHLLHPLFVTYCPGAEARPDPVDSFYGLDLVVNPTSVATLGGGTVVLVDFAPGCELSVHFERLEPGSTTGGGEDGGGPLGGGCADVAGFTASARAPLANRCASCHAGGNSTATNAFDLSSVNDLSSDGQAAACAQTRGKLNLADEPNSILFQRVEPGQATGHPMTIDDPTQFGQFRDAIVSWAVNE